MRSHDYVGDRGEFDVPQCGVTTMLATGMEFDDRLWQVFGKYKTWQDRQAPGDSSGAFREKRGGKRIGF